MLGCGCGCCVSLLATPVPCAPCGRCRRVLCVGVGGHSSSALEAWWWADIPLLALPASGTCSRAEPAVALAPGTLSLQRWKSSLGFLRSRTVEQLGAQTLDSGRLPVFPFCVALGKSPNLSISASPNQGNNGICRACRIVKASLIAQARHEERFRG